MSDERYRNSQLALGWTETYLAVTWIISLRSISRTILVINDYDMRALFTMKCSDPTFQLGPMRNRKDYHETTKLLMKLREEQGRTSTYIPISQRTREKNTLDPDVQQKLERLKSTLARVLIANDIFFFLFVVVAELVARHSIARHVMGISLVADWKDDKW